MRTVSTKIDQNDFDKFMESCNKNGCLVSEKLRELVQNSIEMENDWKNDDQETMDTHKKVIKNIPKCHEATIEEDDDGNLTRAEFIWFTDEELEQISI